MPLDPSKRQSHIIRVSSVSDGDTFRIQSTHELREMMGLSVMEDYISVRFFGIDAPEREQPYGEKAREVVREALLDYPTVAVVPYDVDQYGRLVAEVILSDSRDGECTNHCLNHYLVAHGLAVNYRRFLRAAGMYGLYGPLESSAKRERLNFWSQPYGQIVMPHEYRRRKRMRRSEQIGTGSGSGAPWRYGRRGF